MPPHLIVLEVNQDLVGLKLTVEWRGSPSAAPPNCPLDQRDLATRRGRPPGSFRKRGTKMASEAAFDSHEHHLMRMRWDAE